MASILALSLKRFGLELSQETIEREERFLDELLHWNRQINLTSIRDRDEALEKHLLDSLLLLNYLPAVGSLLDMGSGGGLPGIPLAIARPGLQVVSVDSVGKKINFQKHIKRLLSLQNLQPLHLRLEDIDKEEVFDFVVARALSNFQALIRFSAPLQEEGDQLLVMKGSEGSAELDAYMACDVEGLYCVDERFKYQLPISRAERQVIILTRTSHLSDSLRKND